MLVVKDNFLTRLPRIASAFTKVVTSFVSDIILPIISLLPFLHRNLDEKFVVLMRGPHYDKERGYNTLEQARDDGALVMAYGYVRLLVKSSLYLDTKSKGVI
jgi:large-conductance mechanosensitive channel